MEHIRKQLDININKSGLAKIAQSARVCYIFNNIKDRLVMNINCEAVSFKNGILKVKTKSDAEASEIRLVSQDIKKELNDKLKSNIVSKITIINC